MNRFFARLFAAVLGVIHVAVLGGLAALAVIAVVDPPMAEQVRATTGQVPEDVPMLLAVFGAFVTYVLVMGVVSTLVAINTNLERLVQRVDPSLSPHP